LCNGPGGVDRGHAKTLESILVTKSLQRRAGSRAGAVLRGSGAKSMKIAAEGVPQNLQNQDVQPKLKQFAIERQKC